MKGMRMTTRWFTDGQQTENCALALMAEIVQYLSLNGESVSITMGQYEFLFDALFGLIDHDYSIDEDTLIRQLEDSLRNCFRMDGKLSDAKKLLKEFDERCGQLLSKQSNYVFITTMNLCRVVPSNRTVNGCLIKFHAKLPRKYRNARANLLKVKNHIAVNTENEDYVFVEVRTRGVNDLTAFTVAVEALTVYRGLCHLHFVKSVQLFAGPGDTDLYPLESTLKLGNIHTMHHADGKPAREAHWFEDNPNFTKAITVEKFEIVDERLGRMLRTIKLATKDYQAFCAKALLTYVDALDTRDPEAKFVKLWLCLELLTGVDDAKNIIKRVAFFYVDPDIITAQLRALRAARNSHVHAGAKPVRLGIKNFRLCEFIEHLLVFVISNHFKFEKPSQWGNFMATTTDFKSIDEQIRRLKMVKKFAAPPKADP
jgi:hypothetical protein